MRKTFFLGVLAFALFSQASIYSQVLLSYWNFNNVSPAFNSGTAALGSLATTSNGSGEVYTNNTTRQLSANSASGAIFTTSYLDFTGLGYTGGTFTSIVNGLNNSGSGVRQTTSTGSGGFGTFTDTTVNQVAGDASTGNSLFLANGNNLETGRYFTLSLSSTGYQDLQLSYATRWSSNRTGTQTWTYSTDGTNFFSIPGGALNMPSSATSSTFTTFTLDLSGVSAIENTANFFLRMTYTGITATSPASMSFDNMQLIGVVPEPRACVLLLAGVVGLALRRRGI